MANFEFIALDAKGEQTTGTVEAGSEAEAVSQLRGQGLYPTQVVQAGKGKASARFVAGVVLNAAGFGLLLAGSWFSVQLMYSVVA